MNDRHSEVSTYVALKPSRSVMASINASSVIAGRNSHINALYFSHSESVIRGACGARPPQFKVTPAIMSFLG
jgi:hypothetical protein